MATSEQQLTTLNKTVLDAVNLLKIYVGSKVKGLEEKQKEILEKWFDVTVKEEEEQKKQRAFTERDRDEKGRFIKKQENQATKIFNMAGSIKGMFKKTTMKLGSSLGNMYQSVSMHFKNVLSSIRSHFVGLFGEESEWFEVLGSIKDSIKSMVSWFVGGFVKLFKRTPSWANKMIKTLGGMYKLQLKQLKLDFLGAAKTKKGKSGIFKVLSIILVSIAAGIGAWLHRKLITFGVVIPIFKKIGGLFKIFKKIPGMEKLIKGAGVVSKWLKELLVLFAKFPVIGQVIRGLKFGFRYFGWPLTLLLSIIDLFKGFTETQGNLLEKTKGGLWRAFKGFIELPIRLVGWITENVLESFGVETKNVSDKIMMSIKRIFDYFMDFNPFTYFIDFAEGFFGTKGGFIEKIKGAFNNVMNNMSERLNKWFKPLLDSVTPIIIGVANFFINFWNSAIEWIQSKIPSWLPGKGKILENLSGMTISKIETPNIETTSPIDSINKAEQSKIENSNLQSRKLQEAVDAIKEMEKNRKTDSSNRMMASMNQSNQSVSNNSDQRQIPDEIDNGLVSIKNYNGELD